MQVDHVTVPVRDYAAAKRFYEETLGSFGLVARLDWPDKRKVFFGPEGEPSFLWICESNAAGGLDLALVAPDADTVDRFHAAAVAADARTEFEPGIRPEHNRDYYAARVVDPDGNAIEVVFRGVAAARGRLAA